MRGEKFKIDRSILRAKEEIDTEDERPNFPIQGLMNIVTESGSP